MMSRVFYGLSSLLLVSLTSGQPLTLTLSKDQPVIWRDSVDITCKYDGTKSVYTFALSVTKSGLKDPFVNLPLIVSPLTAKIHADFQSRVELISSQSDLQANKLAVRIKNVTCDDAANYTCKLITSAAGIPPDVKSLTTNAAPESVKISNVGSNLPSFGERLELRCMGNIGNPAAEFEWYIRHGNEAYFTRINDNITMSDPTEENCQYHRQSTLVLYPSVDDVNIYIQCLARNSHGFVNDTSHFELGGITTTNRMYGKGGEVKQGQQLTLTLSNNQPVIWRDSVDITCKYDGTKPSNTYALSVTKSGLKGSFVKLLLNPPLTATIHADFQSRVELISSQSDLQANKLAVRIKNVTCDDAANYTCKLLTTGAGIPPDVKSLTTNAAPESVKISNVGSNLPSVGERLELRCIGNIGNPAAEFEWYIRRENEAYFTRINDNITVSDPTEVKCQYHRQSTLVLYPSVGDANIYIQCIARNSHGFVNDTSHFELASGGLGGGEIAGIVLGILAVIVLVVLLVWFLVIRPNNVPPKDETPTYEIPERPNEKDYGNRENAIYANTTSKDKNLDKVPEYAIIEDDFSSPLEARPQISGGGEYDGTLELNVYEKLQESREEGNMQYTSLSKPQEKYSF